MIPKPKNPRQLTEWLGPINTMRLATAVMRGQDQVELEIKDLTTKAKHPKIKKMFDIRYCETRVFVKCATEYVPCGWFDKGALKRYLEYMSTGE